MILVSNTAAVTLTPGQSLTFNNIIWKSGCAENFRNGSSSIRVTQGVYEISFNGNVSSAGAGVPVQLNIAIDGAALPETTMISTPAVVGDLNNVSASTFVGNQGCCCGNPGSISVSIINTGTGTLTVGANSKFSIKRIA